MRSPSRKLRPFEFLSFTRKIKLTFHREGAIPTESPLNPEYMQDPFLAASSSSNTGDHISSITGLPVTISSPKTAQLYNIFHPSDPIAYRLEPLISPAMSSMKPQLLPYTKRNTISASVSGIGAKVGQSVSGLWSSLSSGIASSLLNRSLGLTNDDVARMEAPQIRSSSQSGKIIEDSFTSYFSGPREVLCPKNVLQLLETLISSSQNNSEEI